MQSLSGKRFGRLSVVRKAEKRKTNDHKNEKHPLRCWIDKIPAMLRMPRTARKGEGEGIGLAGK